MTKRYNYCSKCGTWLGWKAFFKFWTTSKPCFNCENKAL